MQIHHGAVKIIQRGFQKRGTDRHSVIGIGIILVIIVIIIGTLCTVSYTCSGIVIRIPVHRARLIGEVQIFDHGTCQYPRTVGFKFQPPQTVKAVKEPYAGAVFPRLLQIPPYCHPVFQVITQEYIPRAERAARIVFLTTVDWNQHFKKLFQTT